MEMELVLLDNDMFEVDRFTNFDSLVWNERYQSPGDFQLRSYGIEEVTRILYGGRLVGISNSDFVMEVKEIGTDVDSNGNEIVTVSGKTPEGVFEYRPANQFIADLFFRDDVYPDGWEWGYPGIWNPGGEYPHNLTDPMTILEDVIRRVDIEHYGRPELAHLRLPWAYHHYRDESGRGIVGESEFLEHYTIPWDTTVYGVMEELLPLSERGIAVLRPNANSTLGQQHLRDMDRSRPGMFVWYRPRYLKTEISFDYLQEDYTSESVNQSFEHANVHILTTDEGVHIYDGDGALMDPAWNRASVKGQANPGLHTRLSTTTKELLAEDVWDWEYKQTDNEVAELMFENYSGGNTFTLETSGIFPYDHKEYRFGDTSPDAYFLGDEVTLRTRGNLGITAQMQITEYIRSMDSSGYREYPTFKLRRRIGRREHEVITAFRESVVKHTDWTDKPPEPTT